MRPVEFDGQNRVFTAPPGLEKKVQPLPAHNDGEVTTSCWELNKEELEEIQRTGRIYFRVWGGPRPVPVLPLVFPPSFVDYPQSAYHDFHYIGQDTRRGARVYISFDCPPAYGFIMQGQEYLINQYGVKRYIGAGKALDKGDLYMRRATEAEIQAGHTNPVVAEKLAGGREEIYSIIFPPANPIAQ